MSGFSEYLESELGCRAAVIGIQPKRLEFDSPPSDEILSAVDEIARVILSATAIHKTKNPAADSAVHRPVDACRKTNNPPITGLSYPPFQGGSPTHPAMVNRSVFYKSPQKYYTMKTAYFKRRISRRGSHPSKIPWKGKTFPVLHSVCTTGDMKSMKIIRKFSNHGAACKRFQFNYYGISISCYEMSFLWYEKSEFPIDIVS